MNSLRHFGLALVAGVAFTGAAMAADLAVTAADPTEATTAGLYLGLIGGYGLATGDLSGIGLIPDGSPEEISLDGYTLGVQGGVDVDTGSGLLVGVAGDVSWSNISGWSCVEETDVTCTDIDQTGHSHLEATIDWLATLRARVGFDLGGAVVYGTAGIAAADVTTTITDIDGSTDIPGSASHYGWVAGAGAQMEVADNMSVGAEYLYVDLGEADYVYDAPIGDAGQASVTANMVRGSLNVHF